MALKLGDAPSGVLAKLMLVFLFSALTAVSLIFSAYLLLNANSVIAYVIAISFTFLALISGGFNMVSSYSYYKSSYYARYLENINAGLKPMRRKPSVAVVMPVYNEDPGMVARNLAKITQLNYDRSKLKFYMLDDSTEPETASALGRISAEYGAVYMRRPNRQGFKAGALNNMLKSSDEEYIAIFDSDEELVDNNFLTDLLPYFQDPKLCFVQTEKQYAKGSLFSDTVGLFDTIFFKLIQPSRVMNGTALFAGSCAVIKRSALDAIGGFPEYVTEDTFMSFESDMHNFRSLHIPKVYALARPMKSFTELARQQWRYNYGDTQFLLYFLKHKDNTSKKAMSALSKMDYAAHGLGLNYLSSILILFTIFSILLVMLAAPFTFGSVKQIFTPPYTVLNLELLGMGAFLLSILIPITISKVYFNSLSKGIMMFALNFALAFVRLNGALAALFSQNPAYGWFKATRRVEGGRIRNLFRNARVEIGFSAVLFGASAISLLVYNLTGALWLMWYGILYSSAAFFFVRYG